MSPELTITLVLGAYAFAAGGYLFTFRYVQSTAKALWESIKDLRENDLKHLEHRIERLERGN